MTIESLLAEKKEMLIGISDRIWEFAETRFQEYKSAKLQIETMQNEGFAIEEGVADMPTAFIADWSNGSGGPVIALLGEYDALPSLSQKAASDKKEAVNEGGNGHGCGHNLLGAAVMGCAIALKEYLKANNINAVIRYYGCPAEEGGSGKTYMVRDGLFKDVDVAFTWHPQAVNRVWSHSSLANYQIYYRFYGRASHAAAAPHLGRSAFDALELMNIGVNFLREHVIQEARMHYAVTDSGGRAPNVVQPYAEAIYMLRAPKLDQLEEIYQRVNKIAEGAAMMTETEVKIVFDKGVSNIVPNNTLEQLLHDVMSKNQPPQYTPEELAYAASIRKTVPDPDATLKETQDLVPAEKRRLEQLFAGKDLCDFVSPLGFNELPKGGSTDVGDVSWVVPTGQVNTTCGVLGTPGHSWQYTAQVCSSIGHKGMLYAAQILAKAAIEVINNPALIDKAKQELKDRGGDSYFSPIPPEIKPPPDGLPR